MSFKFTVASITTFQIQLHNHYELGIHNWIQPRAKIVIRFMTECPRPEFFGDFQIYGFDVKMRNF